MSVNIGEIIHELVKERGLKAKNVAQALNISESTLYKIYNRETIDIPKLVAFSVFFKKNLFEYYIDNDSLEAIFNSSSATSQVEIQELKYSVSQKKKRIKELEEIIATQKKLLNFLEAEAQKKPRA